MHFYLGTELCRSDFKTSFALNNCSFWCILSCIKRYNNQNICKFFYRALKVIICDKRRGNYSITRRYQMKRYCYLASGDTAMDHYSSVLMGTLIEHNPFIFFFLNTQVIKDCIALLFQKRINFTWKKKVYLSPLPIPFLGESALSGRREPLWNFLCSGITWRGKELLCPEHSASFLPFSWSTVLGLLPFTSSSQTSKQPLQHQRQCCLNKEIIGSKIVYYINA